MSFRILFEREDVLAIEKPAGVPSVDHARGEPSELVAWLRERYPEVRDLGEGPRPAGQAHRLDTATSGVLLIARTEAAREALRAAFSEPGKVIKEYQALLWGELAQSRTVEWEIGMRGRRSQRVKVVSSPEKAKGLRGIRPAVTVFEPVEHCEAATRVRIRIRTGARHQIRAHAEAMGHAVVGDPLYGEQPLLPPGCERRLYLHAQRLKASGVDGVAPFEVESPPPECFTAVWEALCP